MTKERLVSFTDAVIAILITLLVLTLPTPKEASWESLFELRHYFVIYLISFGLIITYWNNHHHLFTIVQKIDGKVLWANNLVILFLSFFPFITSWVSKYPFETAPQVLYGIVILAETLSYWLLGKTLAHVNGKGSLVDQLFTNYRKIQISVGLNFIAVIIGFFFPVAVIIIDTAAFLIWFLPEKRVERHYKEKDKQF